MRARAVQVHERKRKVRFWEEGFKSLGIPTGNGTKFQTASELASTMSDWDQLRPFECLKGP
jgi:hypothetical protein